jgi:hypothetical protein
MASLTLLTEITGLGDDRNGTVSRNDPQFSRFMLTVPTLCLQNYAQETTKISWCPRNDPKWVAGVVWQFFCLIHIQLFGVQEYYLHHVSFPSVPFFDFNYLTHSLVSLSFLFTDYDH